MIVEFYATKCVEEMPSEDMPKAEFFRDLHSEEWRLKTMKAIEKVIPEADWSELLEWLIAYQWFDRDPEGFMYQNGYDGYSPQEVRNHLNDNASWNIDAVARY